MPQLTDSNLTPARLEELCLYSTLPEKVTERFFSKVLFTESCWLWLAGRHNAYGGFSLAGKTENASVISYLMRYGTRPQVARHTCDVTMCVNWDHIIDGTPKQNTEDMVNRGRHRSPPGSLSGSNKLNEADVIAIRKAYASGNSVFYLTRRYEISEGAVYKLLRRETWKHV